MGERFRPESVSELGRNTHSTGGRGCGMSLAELLARNLGEKSLAKNFGKSRTVVAPMVDVHMRDTVHTNSLEIRFSTHPLTYYNDELYGITTSFLAHQDCTLVINSGAKHIGEPLPLEPDTALNPTGSYSLAEESFEQFYDIDAIESKLDQAQEREFQFSSLSLLQMQDSNIQSVLSRLNNGQVNALHIEGLAQTAKAGERIGRAVLVAKNELACNCNFPLSALETPLNTQTSTVSHLDLRSVDLGGRGSGLTDWSKFPELIRLGADSQFILKSASNPKITELTIYDTDMKSLSQIENGKSNLESLLEKVPNATKVKIDLGTSEMSKFQDFFDDLVSQKKIGEWTVTYTIDRKAVIERSASIS